METRKLGSTGPVVSAIGLGAMGMSGMYGPADEAESIATIHAALDAGVTLVDTGDFYGMGHNELLIRDALRGRRREDVVLSVKFGAQRGPDGGWLGYDARPAAVKTALAYTLTRLGTDHVDVYRPARLDPNVPIEDTVGAIAELVAAGYVRHVGLSEVGAQTLRRAAAVHPITDLQIEYSVLSRGIETGTGSSGASILDTCRELGIAITAYGVLSRGLIGGGDEQYGPGDFRAHTPRYQGENLIRNRDLVARLRPIADRHGLSVAQLAIAWAANRGGDVIPVIGMRKRSRLDEAVGAIAVRLDPSDLADIDAAVPPGAAAGERYAPAQFATLDSEV
jgi:aryl-alcohol dehydrogenase-like predicted oxidoreductase